MLCFCPLLKSGDLSDVNKMWIKYCNFRNETVIVIVL